MPSWTSKLEEVRGCSVSLTMRAQVRTANYQGFPKMDWSASLKRKWIGMQVDERCQYKSSHEVNSLVQIC